MVSRPVLTIGFILLAGCERQAESDGPSVARDPQVAQALDDPLMTDPDLTQRNEGGSAIRIISDGSLPVLPATPEAISAAKAEAVTLAGGAERLVLLGDPVATGEALALDATPKQQVGLLSDDPSCSANLRSSAIWAARMPSAMPIYPRGATQSAAGTDAGGCAARTVTFTTPVSISEVMAFYAAMARRQGTQPRLVRAGEELQLSGRNDQLAYDVRACTQGDHTVVRLTTLIR